MFYNDAPIITGPTDLTKALLIYVPGHQDQFYRPFEATLTGENLSKFNVLTQGGVRINANSIADVACDIIAPASTPQGIVGIANGFGNPKLAFFLEFTCKNVTGGCVTREIVTGFTDYVGISETGLIDPNMQFFVNSRMELRDSSFHNAAGHQKVHQIRQNAEILPIVNLHGAAPLRPEDVLAVGQSAEILSMTGGTLLDNRANMAVIPRASNRNNTIPAYYLSKLVDGVVSAERNNDIGLDNGNGDIWENSIASVQTGHYELSAFLNNMGINDPLRMNRFTYAELNHHWPRPDDWWIVNIPNRNNRITDLRASTEHWQGGLVETQLAFSLTHALPALMSRLMIVYAEIEVSNMHMDGIPRAVVLNQVGMFDQAITPQHIQHLENQILIDIVRGVISSKVGIYHVKMKVNLISNSFFEISVNGQPAIPFAAPMFCESFYSPMIGDVNRLNVISASIQEIVTTVLPTGGHFNNYIETTEPKSYEESLQQMYGGIVNHSVARPANAPTPQIILPSRGLG